MHMTNVKDKTIHMIAQGHIDLAWMWPWKDGLQEAMNTVHSVVKLMREFPQLCFSHSSSAIYEWIEETSPALFAEIRGLIDAGRWEVVGGWVVEPDCNLPSGESFVRQSLYGKRYFTDRLGVDVRVGYTVDAFGMCGALPQILRRSGFAYHVYSKPRAPRDEMPLLFHWESADGSRVLTWRISSPGYGQGPYQSADDFEEALRLVARTNFPDGVPHAAFFIGIGDHGGGPTRPHLERALELMEDPQLPAIRFSTLAEFFSCIERDADVAKLPVFRGEIQRHNTGCYSAMAEVKANNRRCENRLRVAEALDAAARLDGKTTQASETPSEAWRRLLFNQFHDIIAGTCTEQCYADVLADQGGVRGAADRTAVRCVHALSQAVDTSRSPSNVLFLFNPLPWKRTCTFDIDGFTRIVGTQGDTIRSMTDLANGRAIRLQWTHGDAAFGPWNAPWGKLLGAVELPPCGYKVFRLDTQAAPGDERTATGGEHELSGACGTLAFDTENVGIASWTDPDGRQVLAGEVALSVIEDTSDTFGHGRNAYDEVIGKVALTDCFVLESGPVRARLCRHGRWGSSRVVMEILVYGELPFIEIRLTVNWQEKHKALKLEVPTAVEAAKVFYEMPYSIENRPADGTELPGQSWSAVAGKLQGADYTVTLANEASTSFDCAGATLRAMIARSVRYLQYGDLTPHEALDYHFQDQGWMRRSFLLAARPLPWRAAWVSRLAQEFNAPVERTMDTSHPGTEPFEKSFLEIACDHVVLGAVKRSETGDGLVVRMFEVEGKADTVRIESEALGVRGEFAIKPYELLTIRFDRSDDGWRAAGCDLLERET